MVWVTAVGVHDLPFLLLSLSVYIRRVFIILVH